MGNSSFDLTNASLKLVKRLSEGKVRKSENAFKAEGTKLVNDTIGHFEMLAMYATSQWVADHDELALKAGSKLYILPSREMSRVSSLTTPSEVVAIYKIPENDFPTVGNGITVALDSIQDPGNLGSIIRTCDWFGVHDIVCSHDTVDLYNPKVVQATMGAISRVNYHKCDLAAFIKSASRKVNVYGTFLDGENIYDAILQNEKGCVVVFGNEGRGISPSLGGLITKRLLIPSYPSGGSTSESLNVAAAAAIVISNFRFQH